MPIAAGGLTGRLAGGRFASLAALRLNRVWLLLLPLALQTALVLAPPSGAAVDPLRVALPLTTGAIAAFAALNRGVPGMWLVLVGTLANLAVICANGGLMPISPESLVRAGRVESVAAGEALVGQRLPWSKDAVRAPEDTQLVLLADQLVTPPLPKRKVMSAGDVAIGAGLFYLVWRTMRADPSAAAGRVRTYKTPYEEYKRGAADTTPPWARSHALRPRRWPDAGGFHAGGALA
ncbi:MAG TPA: DUF5317 domain-containing protein [Chloroflexota bacterium]|nr:DUF5317 domain-containing protein [Chloroflexota bacterium]